MIPAGASDTAALDAVACRPLAVESRGWRSGQLVSRSPLGAEVEAGFGFPYQHVHRADLMAILAAAGIETGLFSDVRSNPTDENLAAGVAQYRAGGHDGVIAFGGGSGLDLGKLVAFMAGQDRPLWDFEDVGDWWARADPAGIAPIIGVPTTAGTGSEVGRASVITDARAHVKKIIFHPKMQPQVVI